MTLFEVGGRKRLPAEGPESEKGKEVKEGEAKKEGEADEAVEEVKADQ